MTTITLPRAVVEQALETIEGLTRDRLFTAEWAGKHGATITTLRAALEQQANHLTIERLRVALVASRIIDPAAVEDPDGYDDGVTLFRIEALHRRIT